MNNRMNMNHINMNNPIKHGLITRLKRFNHLKNMQYVPTQNYQKKPIRITTFAYKKPLKTTNKPPAHQINK